MTLPHIDIKICTWGSVVKTYSSIFLSFARQLLLTISIFKCTVRTGKSSMLQLLRQTVWTNYSSYPSNSSWHGRSSFLFFTSGWETGLWVTVIVLDTWPYADVVSMSTSVVTPASKSATKSCGTEEAGSHVALHWGTPSHRTCNKTW